jgi:hypothetical protein
LDKKKIKLLEVEIKKCFKFGAENMIIHAFSGFELAIEGV